MRKIHENNRTVKPGQPHVGPTQQSPPPPKTCTGFIYTVQSGDTMFRIAQRFGVSLDALIEANPQITDPNRIFPGQRICVPRVEAPGPPPPPQCSGFIYTVKQGDTLFLIAQRFGVTLNALIAANPQITDPNRIQVGQQICVPTGVPTPPPPFCPNGFIYTVQPGDTLFTIAQRFGVTLNALIAANPQITDPNRIFPGQQICIPGPIQPPTCMPPNFIYIVQPGDTLFSIAQRFGTTVQAILALNPQITDPNLIFPGQQICIPGPVQPQFPVCTFRLTPTALAGNSTALAYLDFGRNLVAVVASGLPKLALGVNYFAWLTDGAPTVRIPLELAQGGDSRTLFVGTACPTVNICRFSTILITRDVPQATTPGTDVFFRGNIRQQCGVTSTP